MRNRSREWHCQRAFRHCRQRFKQRYGRELTREQWDALNDRIRRGKGRIVSVRKGGRIHAILHRFQDFDLMTWYSTQHDMVVTIIKVEQELTRKERFKHHTESRRHMRINRQRYGRNGRK